MLRTVMANCADFLPKKLSNISIYFIIIILANFFKFWVQKLSFSKGFFHTIIRGAVTTPLLVSLNEQLPLLPSYWSLPLMNSGPQNEQLLFLPSYWLLPQTSARPNEHMKKPLENGSFRTINVNRIGQKKIVM